MNLRTFAAFAALALGSACAAPQRPAPVPERGPVGVQAERRVFVPPVAEQPAPARPPALPPAPLETPLPPPSLEPAPPPAEALLTEARRRIEADDVAAAAALYDTLEGTELTRDARQARLADARALVAAGRPAEALLVLGDPRASGDPGAWQTAAAALELLGQPVAAVRAYARAAAASPEMEADEFRARARHLLDTLASDQLAELARDCPFCAEGGAARLRLARRLADAGQLAAAESALRALAVDFAGDPLGVQAERQAAEIAARQAVRPGLYGVLLPLTGPLEPFGTRALRGALLGADLLVPGPDPGVRLAVADSAGDPAQAGRAVAGLAARGVVGIVGPLKGAAALAAAGTAQQLGVPLLTLTPASEVTSAGAFRLHLREEDEVASLVQHAVEAVALRRFAVLYPDTPLGRRYRDLFWSEVVAHGGEITGCQGFSAEAGAAGDAIRKLTGVYRLSAREVRERFVEQERIRLRRERELLLALGIGDGLLPDEELEVEVDPARLAEYEPPPIVDFDAVFLPVNSVQAAQIAPLFPFHDVDKVVLLGVRSWNHPSLLEIGDEYVEGALFAAEVQYREPGALRFAEQYRSAFGEDPGVIEAYAFDAVRLLRALRPFLADETRPGLQRRLASVWAADGLTGPLTAHPGGDIASTPKIFTVRRGRIVPAE